MKLFHSVIKSQLAILFLPVIMLGCKTTDGNQTSTSIFEKNKKDLPLISAHELFGRNEAEYDSAEKGFIIIDMQSKDEYSKFHIRNAQNITREQINGEAFDKDGNTMKKELELILGNLGIKSDDEIIIYDNQQNTNACRLWWLLKLFGHEKILILDGGLNYWKEVGNELTETINLVKPNEYHFIGEERKDIFANIDDVKQGLKDKNTVLLDVRSLEEYDGSKLKDGASFAGNINDCTNLEFKTSLNEGGSKNQCFKNIKELKKMFEEEGITNDKKIIVYCHSGSRSAHTTFVLTELLGYKNVSNYDGSWVEWSSINKIGTINE